jgi:hypothetical protein
MSEELRMNAYWYSSIKITVREFDIVLSAIACAGKGSHHADSWDTLPETTFYPFKGNSYIEFIQNAAIEVSDKIKSLEAQKAIMVEALGYYANRMDPGCTAREALKQCEEMRDKYE